MNKSKAKNELQIDTSEIHDVLLNIGIPPNLLGYLYIVFSMQLIISDPEYLHYITKGLYVDVAARYNSTPSRVERAMRHAIGAGWLYGNIDYINQIFKYCINDKKGAPSNSLFLSGLYYYLQNT